MQDQIKDMNMLDRMCFQQFLSQTLDYLLHEKSFYDAVLEKKPGDITAMGQNKRVDNDISILLPLVKFSQKCNLEDIEDMTHNKFAYLLENKNMSKDLLKKT